jgi:hypothetical protein
MELECRKEITSVIASYNTCYDDGETEIYMEDEKIYKSYYAE